MSFRYFILTLASLFLFAATPARAEEKAPAKPASEQSPAPAKPAAEAEKPQARREDVEPDTLADAKTMLKQARADRDEAEKNAKAADELLTTATTERDTAQRELADTKGKLTTSETNLTAANDKFTKLTAGLKATLNLTDEQVRNLVSDDKIIPFAIENLAGRKAVEIAASQGTSPVITKPATPGATDDFKEALAEAAKETDPIVRGRKFAEADARFAKKRGNN